MNDYIALIRDIPDFPKPGIVFKDITPLLAHGDAFAALIKDLATPWRASHVHVVAGIESRGFILGAALARELGCGFVPLRKPGKLPGPVIGVDFALEYGQDRLEMHKAAIAADTRVLISDDVLATGGTLLAARTLIEQAGGSIAGASLLMELSFLNGRERWHDVAPLHALLSY